MDIKALAKFRTLLFILVVIGVLVWSIPAPREELFTPDKEKSADQAKEAQTRRYETTLYLPDANQTGLLPTAAMIETPPSPEEKIRGVLVALIANENFFLLPKETKIREVFFYNGEAVISLDSSFRSKFTGSATDELLAVTALVNSVVATVETTKRVVILIDDQAAELFVSHVELGRPFLPDYRFDITQTAISE